MAAKKPAAPKVPTFTSADLQAEQRAMAEAWEALRFLNPDARRRALMWLDQLSRGLDPNGDPF